MTHRHARGLAASLHLGAGRRGCPAAPRVRLGCRRCTSAARRPSQREADRCRSTAAPKRRSHRPPRSRPYRVPAARLASSASRRGSPRPRARTAIEERRRPPRPEQAEHDAQRERRAPCVKMRARGRALPVDSGEGLMRQTLCSGCSDAVTHAAHRRDARVGAPAAQAFERLLAQRLHVHVDRARARPRSVTPHTSSSSWPRDSALPDVAHAARCGRSNSLSVSVDGRRRLPRPCAPSTRQRRWDRTRQRARVADRRAAACRGAAQRARLRVRG